MSFIELISSIYVQNEGGGGEQKLTVHSTVTGEGHPKKYATYKYS